MILILHSAPIFRSPRPAHNKTPARARATFGFKAPVFVVSASHPLLQSSDPEARGLIRGAGSCHTIVAAFRQELPARTLSCFYSGTGKNRPCMALVNSRGAGREMGPFFALVLHLRKPTPESGEHAFSQRDL
jgi:hypothetical protein